MLPTRAGPSTADFFRRGVLFVLVGIAVYVGLYVLAEELVRANTVRNRFFAVDTAPLARYDAVILGASHAAVFDYEDMNARLEALTDSRILNLSTVGGGIVVNRLLLDYFLARHDTKAVIYFVDSFAFYSRQWNEERLNDARLFDRAPFDPALAGVLLRSPAGRGAALDYVLGFSKINDQERFRSDVGDDEAHRFGTTYRPVAQIDAQRIRYLYPGRVDERQFDHYLNEFEDMLRLLGSRHVRVVVVKPPVPERFYRALPSEGLFDQKLAAIVARQAVEFHDFSLVCNEERFFFNPDHLNRAGVLNFYQSCLGPLLRAPAASAAPRAVGAIRPKLDVDAIFPPGDGRDLVLQNCTSCHTILLTALARKTANEWRNPVTQHADRVPGLSDAQRALLWAYLVENFAPGRPIPDIPDDLRMTWSFDY